MRSVGVTSFLCGASLLVLGCGSGTDSAAGSEEPGAGGQPSIDAGAAGAGGGAGGSSSINKEDEPGHDGGVPKHCDTSASPFDEACLVSDEFAVFVSAGSSGTGAKNNPVGKIETGIDLARKSGKVLVVCNGDYDERVVVERGSTGVRAYGGFACPGAAQAWIPDAAARTRIAPKSAGVALTVDDVFGGVVVSNIDVAAADATEPGASSLAVHVAGSMNVRFEGLTITSGRGADGARGEDGSDAEDEADPTVDQEGLPAACHGSSQSVPGAQLGGWPFAVNGCGSQGGLGGHAAINARGEGGTDGLPYSVSNSGSASFVFGEDGEDGRDGARGVSGPVGSPASTAGSFTDVGFIPADGRNGLPGTPGQGGGGGGSSASSVDCIGATGGAGGSGGCEGGGATGGRGGGASVGVLIWDSKATFESVKIQSGDGGSGGEGGHGGVGGNGGRGATGGSPSALGTLGPGWGGRGGDGGWGGNGGSGSGATGGPSHAIVVHGPLPTQNDVSFVTTNGGKPGKGGVVKTTIDVNPAPDGTAGKNDVLLVVP